MVARHIGIAGHSEIAVPFGKHTMTVIQLKGPLDAESVPHWREIIIDQFANSEGDAVLDFRHVSFVDTTAMALFLSLNECLATMGRLLVFRNLSGQPKKAFRVLKFDESADALRERTRLSGNGASNVVQFDPAYRS